MQAATPITIKMQQLCAECLGLLGAVDPARVQACPVAMLLPQMFTCLATDDKASHSRF